MRRFLFILLSCIAFGSDGQASDLINPQPEIRAYENNSTDELALLQRLIEAKKFYAEGNYRKSARLFSIITKYDPTLEPALIGLSESYIALDRSDMAHQALSDSKLKSEKLRRLKLLAAALVLPVEERVTFLKKILTRVEDPRLYNLLAKTSLQNGSFQEARETFQKAEALGQKPGVLLNNLGMLELERGNIEIAVSHFAKAQEVAPDCIRFDNNHRLALLLKGDYISALEGLDSNRAADFLVDGGFIALSQNEMGLAKLLFEKANEISPVFNSRAQKGLALFE